MDFIEFKELQRAQFVDLSTDETRLFVVDADKDELWETYLNSFPPGTNEIFRERREFDCSCCRNFIRSFGNVVAIKENKLVSIWDFVPADDKFSVVTQALSQMVKSAPVCDVLVTHDKAFGTDLNLEQLDDGTVMTWNHFRIDLPSRFITKASAPIGETKSRYRDSKNVFKRSLEELSRESFETVLDLIAEKTLYRGDEWLAALEQFVALYDEYHALTDEEKDNYCWKKSTEISQAVARIRNHSMGVLLKDISENVSIEEALDRWESIMAPTHYKRPKAVFTKQMVDAAQETVANLGLLDSLGRRHATLADIKINNVIWANKDAATHMDGIGGVFAALKDEVAIKPRQFDNAKAISVDEFVEVVLPDTTNLSVMLENRHSGNLVSLIAPQNPDSPTLFKWGNPFSWAYQGNITDSMKERVKAAGGNVEGVLRFSLQWNENGGNQNDFDAHCYEPNGNHIWYQNKGRRHDSSGMLDVDIIYPGPDQVAVENITWTDRARMGEGNYKFNVKNFAQRNGIDGFDAQIEFDGQIFEFVYHKRLLQDEVVLVAIVNYNRENGFKIVKSLPHSTSSKEMWGVQTYQFQPVSVFMFSPNFWDGQKGIGHKHYFFMMADCKNPDRPNGFFNEYLRDGLVVHKRVFEALGSKMRVDYADDQLSGIGFSSTKRDVLVCKADEQVFNIIF